MFQKTSKTESSVLGNTPKKTLPSVLSSELHILGNLISSGPIDVDGSVEGNVKGDQVTIRQSGRVAGDVVAEVVHVYGEVRGLIRATAVHLYSSARIEGVIIHKSLTVEDGAFIDAKFKRMDAKVSADPLVIDEENVDSLDPKPLGNLRLIG